MTTAVIVMKSGHEIRFECSDLKVKYFGNWLISIAWKDGPNTPLWVDIKQVVSVIAED